MIFDIPTCIMGPDYQREEHVYFVRCGEYLKVGFTSDNLRNRLSSMQTGSPHRLALVASIRGGRGVEKKIHTSLAMYPRRGEWFALPPEDAERIVASVVLAHGGEFLPQPMFAGWGGKK